MSKIVKVEYDIDLTNADIRNIKYFICHSLNLTEVNTIKELIELAKNDKKQVNCVFNYIKENLYNIVDEISNTWQIPEYEAVNLIIETVSNGGM